MWILWENYCYDFGGKTYIQKEGGPIVQRPTMATTRLVMEELFTEYRRVLEKAEVKIMMMKVYVDDGRQLTTLLRKGMRYWEEEKEFRWDMKAEEEDKLMEEQGENKDNFMARLCLSSMNAVNKDLTFTAEVAADFVDNWLPTLDFTLWQEEEGKLSHRYYVKSMKTQVMLEKNSAMGNRQKYMIQANELTRRLYNVDEELSSKNEEIVERAGEVEKEELDDEEEEYHGVRDELCLNCVLNLCVCMLDTVNMRIELLKLGKEIKRLEAEKKASDERVYQNMRQRTQERDKTVTRVDDESRGDTITPCKYPEETLLLPPTLPIPTIPSEPAKQKINC